MGFPGYMDFQHDHLGNVAEEQRRKELKMEAEKHFKNPADTVPEDFDIPEVHLAPWLKDSYVLMLKHRTDSNSKDRLMTMPMTSPNVFSWIEHEAIERYWFFDPSIPETLLFAAADACQTVPNYQARKILNSFNVTKHIERRAFASVMKSFEDRFTMTYGHLEGTNIHDGIFVYFTNYKGEQDVISDESPFDVLVELRGEMLECRMCEDLKLLAEAVDTSGDDTTSNTVEDAIQESLAQAGLDDPLPDSMKNGN